MRACGDLRNDATEAAMLGLLAVHHIGQDRAHGPGAGGCLDDGDGRFVAAGFNAQDAHAVSSSVGGPATPAAHGGPETRHARQQACPHPDGTGARRAGPGGAELAAPDAIEIIVIKTTGDVIQDRPLSEAGGKGLFVKEIEEAMLAAASMPPCTA